MSMLNDRFENDDREVCDLADVKATNLVWHEGHVSRAKRESILNQRGCIIWLTGLPSAGKSTIAFTVEHILMEQGRLAYVLDGDNVRHGLNKNLGFSAEDRAENIRRIGEVGKLFTDAGLLTFTSFVSPYKSDRDAVRALMSEEIGRAHGLNSSHLVISYAVCCLKQKNR